MDEGLVLFWVHNVLLFDNIVRSEELGVRNVGEASLPNILIASQTTVYEIINYFLFIKIQNSKLIFSITIYNSRAQHPALLTPHSSLLTFTRISFL